MFRKKNRKVPELNTSALPDLIFTVLFFFMIVTHMRQTDIKLKVESPYGSQLQKMQKKYGTAYIYIGKDNDGNTRIQLNNELTDLSQLSERVMGLRDRVPPEEQQDFTVSLKADRETPLEVIAGVKAALREASILKINYSATEKTFNKPNE